jgi:hypothetical protein
MPHVDVGGSRETTAAPFKQRGQASTGRLRLLAGSCQSQFDPGFRREVETQLPVDQRKGVRGELFSLPYDADRFCMGNATI